MKKPMIAMLVLALAALGFAQGDHVPAYRDPAPTASQLMPILPADQRVGENFKYPYQVHAYELATEDPGRDRANAVLLLLRAHRAFEPAYVL